jgi:hypothetical protein
MPFGHVNVPSTFLQAMNGVISPFTGKFISVIYMVFYFTNKIREHLMHLQA